MHRLALATAIALTVGVANAQMHNHGHGPAISQASAQKQAVAEGEVRRIDRTKGTVMLKHGPLEALGMGPMTMVFEATDAKLLANVKEGDKVKFVPGEKDGKLVVSSIEVVK
jgi:Cu(I)/Ag(I) efflux system protein CusF